MPVSDGNLSNFSRHYASRKLQWEKVRHAIEGEDQIKFMGKAYLPQPSGMTNKEYQNYKDRSMFYGVAERTLRGMTGMVFRKEPLITVPDAMKPFFENTTSDDHTFSMFLDELIQESLSIGRSGVLVDHYSNATVNDLPHLCTYKAEDITQWKEQKIDGFKKLVRVILRDENETTVDADTQEYIELALLPDPNGVLVYTVQRYKTEIVNRQEMRVNIGELITPLLRGKPLDYIPFFFINAYNLRPEVSKPPFLDLVNMNISHYRNSADYEHALYMTAQPTPWVSGVMSEDSKPRSIGPSTIWYLSEGGSAGLIEFTGKGIEAQQHAMKDKEDRMAALGARMIAENANRNETVDTARLRGRGEMSLLLSVVNTIEAALTAILKLVAEWGGIESAGIEVEMNRDFVETRMSHQEITALVNAWQMGAISHDSLISNFKRGEIVDPDVTAESEYLAAQQDTLRIPTIATGAPAPTGVPNKNSQNEPI